MNVYLFIQHFFSNERLQIILNKYSLNPIGVNRELVTRLVEHDNFDVNDLKKFFNKHELVNLCIIFKQRYSGSKNVLWSRLVQVIDFSKIELNETKIDNLDQGKDLEEINRILNLLEEQFYFDIGRFVHNVVDNSNYSKDVALLKIQKIYPTKSIETINEAFDYVNNAYTEVFALVKKFNEEYYNEWTNKGINRSKNGLLPFERELHQKYHKISKERFISMIDFNFMWYYLK